MGKRLCSMLLVGFVLGSTGLADEASLADQVERSFMQMRFPSPLLQQLCLSVDAYTVIGSSIVNPHAPFWQPYALAILQVFAGTITNYPWLQPVLLVLFVLLLIACAGLALWSTKLVVQGSAKAIGEAVSKAVIAFAKAKYLSNIESMRKHAKLAGDTLREAAYGTMAEAARESDFLDRVPVEKVRQP